MALDQIANRSMEDLGYAYLHCDLLDMGALTTIILKVKLLHVKMHEQHLQKGMFMKVENFGLEPKSKRGFEKGDMHVVIIIELITIVSSILIFQLELVPMFFHMDSIREFRNSIQSWRFATSVVIVTSVRGIGDIKRENIVDYRWRK
jgi:hypothetical protein